MTTPDLQNVWPEWTIEKQLGRGTFGTVWQAVRHTGDLTSRAAIKRISIPQDPYELDALRSDGLDLQASRTYLKRIVEDFSNECRMMESFKGIQNIVSIEDYKVIEHTDVLGWDIYIRMELLTPFSTYLCDRKMTEEEVIQLGCDICTALEFCARRNIIHRDIKPDNIFVNSFGSFKLGDFGTARNMESLTGGLSQKGTFNYMAPEVISGSEYDARVDIYSLGLVLYRLLNNNRLPFISEKQLLSPAERRNAFDRRMRGETLPAPCSASPEIAQVILKACAFRPEDRYESAAQMRKALQAVSHNEEPLPAVSAPVVREAPAAKAPEKKERKVREKKSGVSLSAPEMYIDAPDFSNSKKKSPLTRVLTVLLVLLLLVGLCAALYRLGVYLHNARCNLVLDIPVGETTVPTDEPALTEPIIETTVPDDLSDTEDSFSFENMTVECSFLSDVKNTMGCNSYGEQIFWCIYIDFDMTMEQRSLLDYSISCSWDEVVNGGGEEVQDVGFSDAKQGVTYAEYGSLPATINHLERDRFSFMLMLPDDPSIAGEQTITVQVGNSIKVIHLTLEYLGDYETGIGWFITDIYYDDYSNVADKLLISNVLGTGLYLEDPIFELNSQGKYVDWVINFDYYLKDDTLGNSTPIISSSWDNAIEQNFYWGFRDIFNSSNGDETQFLCTPYQDVSPSLYNVKLMLPDDPSIAGEQTITIQVGEYIKQIHLTLEYLGGYETGTGWAISNVYYDDTLFQSEPLSETTVPNDFSDTEDSISFDNMTVDCSVHYNPEKTMGYNSYDELVCWCISIDFDMTVAQSILLDYSISCSWDEVVNGGGELVQNVGFSDAKQGMTYAEYCPLPASVNPHYERDRFSFMLMLPDDPSIAGEQTITVQVGNSIKVIHLTLEYLGDYETGTGWAIAEVYYGDDAGGDNKLPISNVVSTCMYLEDPRIGYNSRGEYVDWIITFDYYLNDDTLGNTTPVISSSWDNTIEQNIYWDFRYAYNSTNGAETQFVYFPYYDRTPYSYHVTLFLPDDPSIAGDQIIGIRVGDLLGRIHLTLKYLGDYETGTGWAISNVSYD